ncbi:MAG: glycosyltransferase [Micropruina sp.]|uniref:glycosyltransferase n=1 Tax=Micropruina sp. TaxID=2737536 RepID=UPI0039E586AC
MNDLYPPVAPSSAKSLLVCSTGGHLSELIRLEQRLGIHPDSLWLTFDTPQARQLLRGRRVHHLPYVGARDLKGTLSTAPDVIRILRSERFEVALSTGSAIAAAALPIAAMHRIPSVFVESVCRVRGPSTTGRILQRIPGISLYTQHPGWAGGRWKACESVFSDVRSEPIGAPDRPERIFVTLGTFRGYRFDTLVDSVLASGYANENTIWQLGDTERSDRLPGEVHQYMSPSEFTAAAKAADVVVTHAGVGTLLEMLAMGKYPVLATRRAIRNEHVDDHQTEIAEWVNRADLGIAVDGPEVTGSVIERASRRRILDGAASTDHPQFAR